MTIYLRITPQKAFEYGFALDELLILSGSPENMTGENIVAIVKSVQALSVAEKAFREAHEQELHSTPSEVSFAHSRSLLAHLDTQVAHNTLIQMCFITGIKLERL